MRGLSPYPGTWTTLASNSETEKTDASVMKIFKTAKTGTSCAGVEPGTLKTESNHLLVATNDEWLDIVELQAAGKKRMAARDFLNGFKHIADMHMK